MVANKRALERRPHLTRHKGHEYDAGFSIMLRVATRKDLRDFDEALVRLHYKDRMEWFRDQFKELTGRPMSRARGKVR